MCPVCFATAMLIASSAVSTSGLAAAAIRKFGVKGDVDDTPPKAPGRGTV